jgi:hypothetical protein
VHHAMILRAEGDDVKRTVARVLSARLRVHNASG